MDAQLTDFENATLSVFFGMLANMISSFDLDFILPMTLVDENMKRACSKDAVTRSTFWWKVPKEEFAKLTRLNDMEESNFLKSNTSTFGRPSEDNYESLMPTSC